MFLKFFIFILFFNFLTKRVDMATKVGFLILLDLMFVILEILKAKECHHYFNRVTNIESWWCVLKVLVYHVRVGER